MVISVQLGTSGAILASRSPCSARLLHREGASPTSALPPRPNINTLPLLVFPGGWHSRRCSQAKFVGHSRCTARAERREGGEEDDEEQEQEEV